MVIQSYPHTWVISPSSIIIVSDDFAQDLGGRCADRIPVTSLTAVRRALDALEPRDVPMTLDLVGHSTRGARLLRLGQTVVDMTDLRVSRFFEDLAPAFQRLRVAEVRLLGCETATQPINQRTIRALASMLRLHVYGTRKMISAHHFTAGGFDPAFGALLVESADLPSPPAPLE